LDFLLRHIGLELFLDRIEIVEIVLENLVRVPFTIDMKYLP